MVLDLISRIRELRNYSPNRHTGLTSLSSRCFANKQATRKPLTSVSSRWPSRMPFGFFYQSTRKRQPPVRAQQRASWDEIDNVARRFELPQPVREPKFIGKRDHIVGRRNCLTPQGGNLSSTNCF